MEIQRGQVRVGKCRWKRGVRNDPKFSGFTSCVVLTKSSKYGSLGPYMLKDGEGIIIENKWQFSKVYENVPVTEERYSAWDKRIIWSYPSEKHVTSKGKVNQQYFKWREKGFACQDAVRYPVGYRNRHKCLFALANNPNGSVNLTPLDYIASRKAIYVPLYMNSVKEQQQFKELKARLLKGENLLIIEVDGPHQESLGYYKHKYNVDDKFIENETLLATKENLEIMLNDPKHPFGHGYCLAAALLEILFL